MSVRSSHPSEWHSAADRGSPTKAFSDQDAAHDAMMCKLTWLVLGEDPAARSHRVEQFTAL
jgi:hypothetical protein